MTRLHSMFRLFALWAPIVLALMASTAAAQNPLLAGNPDAGFGAAHDGYVRIAFDRPGESKFDSARAVRVRSEGILSERAIYVAGLTGDRISIVKLHADGALDTRFGTNGIAASFGSRMTSFGGLAFGPGGEVVIGYAPPVSAGSDAFVVLETYTQNGQFIDQRGAYLEQGSQRGCHVDNVATRALVSAPNGALALVGSYRRDSSHRLPFIFSVVYDSNSSSHYAANPLYNDQVCGANIGVTNLGLVVPSLPNNGQAHVDFEIFSAAFLTNSDLRISGFQRDLVINFPFAELGLWYGGYVAIDPQGQPTPSGFGFVQNGYFEPNSGGRQTYFKSSHWRPSRGELTHYGEGEWQYYASGTAAQPIITPSPGSSSLSPAWFQTSSTFNTASQTSAYVVKGLRLGDKHVVVATLRNCFISDCSGEFNRYWVGITATGTPDIPVFPGAYSGEPTFGTDGRREYYVRSYDLVNNAPRAFATDAAFYEADDGDGSSPIRHLIVVGDFRSPNATDPNDFDWFVSKVRVQYFPGRLSINHRAGNAAGTITSNSVGGAQLNCTVLSIACAANFPAGAVVTLTQTPNLSTTTFAGWPPSTGCATGPTQVPSTCTVVIDGDLSFDAAFNSAPADAMFADSFED